MPLSDRSPLGDRPPLISAQIIANRPSSHSRVAPGGSLFHLPLGLISLTVPGTDWRRSPDVFIRLSFSLISFAIGMASYTAQRSKGSCK